MKKIYTLTFALIAAMGIQAQVTIENLLNAPFPTALTASPDGKHVAWVFNDQGVRNIFVADAPDFAPRKITNYSQDDGQEISSVQFTHDNSRIIFIRGGAPNSAGELPNPIAIQPNVERAIWIINTDGRNLKKLATGFYPKLSPDGKSIAYLNAGQVWLVKTDSAGTGKKLFHSRGSQNNMRWSPDGRWILYSMAVGGNTDIYKVPAAGGESVRLTDSPGIDVGGSFSPDGTKLVFSSNRYGSGPGETNVFIADWVEPEQEAAHDDA